MIDLLLSKHKNKEQLKASYKELYESGINDIDKDGNTRFLHSVIHKNEAFYLRYMNNPLVRIEEPNKDKKTALHYFVEQHNFPAIQQYLTRHPDVLIAEASNLIAIAANNNFLDIVVFLLDEFLETEAWKKGLNTKLFDESIPLQFFAKQNNVLRLEKYLDIFASSGSFAYGQVLMEHAVANCSIERAVFLLMKFQNLSKKGKIQHFDESRALSLAFKHNNLDLMKIFINLKCVFPLQYNHYAALRSKVIWPSLDLEEALANKANDYTAAIKLLYEYNPVATLLLLSSRGDHRALFKELRLKTPTEAVYGFFSNLLTSNAAFLPDSPALARQCSSAAITVKKLLIEAMQNYNLERVVLVLKAIPLAILWKIYNTPDFQNALTAFKQTERPLVHPGDAEMTEELSVARSADRQEIFFHIENSMLASRSAEVKQFNKPEEPEAKKTVWKGAFFAGIEANNATQSSASSAPDKQSKQMNWRFT